MAEIQRDSLFKQHGFPCFGIEETDDDAYAGAGVADCDACSDEWLPLFGDEVLESKFQDGHYVYSVVAGGGSGDDVFHQYFMLQTLKMQWTSTAYLSRKKLKIRSLMGTFPHQEKKALHL